jgi:predicted dehydrogenase
VERARALASPSRAAVETDWRQVVESAEIDAVMVATTHDHLARIAAEAAARGKHVLVEKPGARAAAELDAVEAAARATGARVRFGFNHRVHRALRKAREIAGSGVLGDLLFVRGRYGHGGRPGYDREWRARPEISGGGEAIDQGMHLIDLARWFLGDLTLRGGVAPTYFWNMPVEDNAFLLLETARGQVASLHASWTEWKNLFHFEICGRVGKLEIQGLGGSYGVERLAHYQMLPHMGPPETTIYEYPMADDSWEVELGEFLTDIATGREPEPGIGDARAALEIVAALYRRHRDDHH